MKGLKVQTLKLIAALFAVISVVSAVFLGVRLFERNIIQKADADRASSLRNSEDYEDAAYVYINGNKYKKRYGITSILLIGIDAEGKMQASDSYNNAEQCDFVTLLVFDDEKMTCNAVQLNRDTMTDIPVLSADGRRAGTVNAQLALAHTYGTGMSDSCRNTVSAASNLLFGTEIDYYFCLNMSAVSIINDSFGGVTLEALDNISGEYPFVKGETVTLKGPAALAYIRARGNADDKTNIARMERQTQYMKALAEKVSSSEKMSEESFYKTYDKISNYIVSDCSINKMISLYRNFSEYTLEDIIVPDGESVEGEEFMEFNVDDEQLKNIIIELFYDQVQ